MCSERRVKKKKKDGVEIREKKKGRKKERKRKEKRSLKKMWRQGIDKVSGCRWG